MKIAYQKLFGVSFAFVAFSFLYNHSARAQSCATAPTCESLGYTKTQQDCSGLNSLKCPFDMSKVYCTTYNDLDPLAIGDFVYDDLSTSRPERYQTEIAKGKTVLGIVVNVNKRIAAWIDSPKVYLEQYSYNSEVSASDFPQVKEIHNRLKPICPEVTLTRSIGYMIDGKPYCNTQMEGVNVAKKSGKDVTKQLQNLLGNNLQIPEHQKVEFYLPSYDDLSEIGSQEVAIIQNNLKSIGRENSIVRLNNSAECVTVKLAGDCSPYGPSFVDYEIVDGEAVHFLSGFPKDVSIWQDKVTNFSPFLRKGNGNYYTVTYFSLFFDF